MPSTAQSHSRLSRLHAGSGLDRPFAVRVSHRPVCRRRRAARFIARTTAGLSSRPSLLPQRALRPCPPCSADHRGTARLALAGRSVGSRPSRPPAATNADRLTSPATAVTPPQPRSVPPLQCCACLFCRAPHTHDRAPAAPIRALIGPRTPLGPSTPPCAPRTLTPAHFAQPTHLRRGHTQPTWTATGDAQSRRGGRAGQPPRSRRAQIESVLLRWPEPPRRTGWARRCAVQRRHVAAGAGSPAPCAVPVQCVSSGAHYRVVAGHVSRSRVMTLDGLCPADPQLQRWQRTTLYCRPPSLSDPELKQRP